MLGSQHIKYDTHLKYSSPHFNANQHFMMDFVICAGAVQALTAAAGDE